MTTTHPRLIGTVAVAACLVAAPTLEILEELISPLVSTSTRADIVAISQHQNQFVVSVLIGMAATLLFLPGLLGLAARTFERAPVASRLAAGLLCVGLPGFMAIRLGQAIELQGVRDGLPSTTTANLVDHLGSNPLGIAVLVCFLGGTVVGLITLGVAAWRAGLPRPAAVLVGAFGVVDNVTEGVVPGWLTHLVLLVGLAWISIALVRADRPQAATAWQGSVATA
jgi:hypothetical protein